MDVKSAAIGAVVGSALTYVLLRRCSSKKETLITRSSTSDSKQAASVHHLARLDQTALSLHFDQAVGSTALDPWNRLLRKAETVIQRRTDRILLVVERTSSSHNYSALLRTAEALGVQHVWCVNPPSFDADEQKRSWKKKKIRWDDDAEELRDHVAFAKMATSWLTVRNFDTTAELIAALRAEGRTIWCTDLSQHAESLGEGVVSTSMLPDKLAICFGTELAGATVELLGASDKRVYLPLHGYADSLNLSVAGALVMQRLFQIDPSVVGSMSEEERAQLRLWFYPEMGRDDEQKAYFAKIAADINAGAVKVQPFGDLRRSDEHRKHQGANVLDPTGQELRSGLNNDPRPGGRKAGRAECQRQKAAAAARREAAELKAIAEHVVETGWIDPEKL